MVGLGQGNALVLVGIGALVVGWFSIANIGSQTWMWITYVVVACVMAFLLYTWPDVNMRTIGAAWFHGGAKMS